eukprot:113420-Alexandrium_andersonii.AAC.1
MQDAYRDAWEPIFATDHPSWGAPCFPAFRLSILQEFFGTDAPLRHAQTTWQTEFACEWVSLHSLFCVTSAPGS